tara:strand:+ start:7950 stop:9377 length:1428 start_codon:yes stop_codon:yes gene_type:complete
MDGSMNHWNTNLGPARISRRDMLRQSSAGFGSLALAALLGGKSQAGQTPFEPQPHFTPKAKRVIFLFMHGGPSHMDTFDYKPQLQKDSGKPLPFDKPKIFSAQTGNLLGSPWKFQRHGESGAWVSELFPHVAGCVDDLCIINSMYGSNSRHGGALLELHTGSDTFVRPSMGSWITYGLGSENQDLPGFITVCPTLTHGGVNAYSSSFLPADFQGTPIGNASIPADRALIPFISNKSGVPYSIQRKELDFLQQMNREHLTDSGPDADLEGRINSFELAYRMQMAAPELQDISDESEATQKMYGLDQDITKNFGRQCLMARRFAERGVRFVQITHSYKWDQHSGLKSALPRNCMEVDQPIAALIKDLKSRGLLEDTLVLWGGEFGRTPVSQGENGRDHNPQGYTMWMAGGGIKAGLQYGATDDYGYYAVKNKIHVHDLHATMLHLLGLDHQKLTYKFAGRDFRLTDVHGEVMYDLFA